MEVMYLLVFAFPFAVRLCTFLPMYRVHISSCTKIYGRATIFSELEASFSGRVLGIGGRNGSGKTTLLKMMSGLISPTSGEIRWMRTLNDRAVLGGADLGGTDDAAWISSDELPGMIGLAAPWMNGYAELNGVENLEFVADLRSWRMSVSRQERRDTLKSHLVNLGLSGTEAKLYRELSSGQQQRLRLALATFFEPEILFLDEPSTNLDESGAELVHSLIGRRRSENKLTVLASNVADELHWCEDVIWLERND